MHGLPEFIFQLATDVNWEEEQPCFENIAQVLAKWYSTPSAGINDAHEEEEDKTSYTTKESSQNKDALMLEHVLFPATKNATFCAPNALNDASFVAPVACLTNLYKIFERC
jgi:hypothetical protein